MDQGEIIARRVLSPLRPRVSLASGSVLVLLTLFLPIGYQSCGPETKGYELLQGKGDWPTFMGVFLSDFSGPVFYGFVLLLAAGTAVLTAISLWKPDLLWTHSIRRPLFIISGTLSLFLVSDVIALVPMAADTYGGIAAGLIVVSCLVPGKFWPARIFWRWIGLMAIAVLIFLGLSAMKWIQGDVPAWFMLGIWVIYGLGPLGMWWTHASGRRAFGAEWSDLRRGLAAFYFTAVLGNLWFFYVAWREGIWGFVPCWFGIHLMALGYMRLAKEAEHAQANPPAAGD
jgi:hypothetical protein